MPGRSVVLVSSSRKSSPSKAPAAGSVAPPVGRTARSTRPSSSHSVPLQMKSVRGFSSRTSGRRPQWRAAPRRAGSSRRTAACRPSRRAAARRRRRAARGSARRGRRRPSTARRCRCRSRRACSPSGTRSSTRSLSRPVAGQLLDDRRQRIDLEHRARHEREAVEAQRPRDRLQQEVVARVAERRQEAALAEDDRCRGQGDDVGAVADLGADGASHGRRRERADARRRPRRRRPRTRWRRRCRDRRR